MFLYEKFYESTRLNFAQNLRTSTKPDSAREKNLKHRLVGNNAYERNQKTFLSLFVLLWLICLTVKIFALHYSKKKIIKARGMFLFKIEERSEPQYDKTG